MTLMWSIITCEWLDDGWEKSVDVFNRLILLLLNTFIFKDVTAYDHLRAGHEKATDSKSWPEKMRKLNTKRCATSDDTYSSFHQKISMRLQCFHRAAPHDIILLYVK